MKVIRLATSGTLESSDILITVKPHNEGVFLEMESDVKTQYGKSIEKIIRETVVSLGVEDVYIKAQDKGALDYAIKARLETALARASE